jgi:catechol 2,3-dioxygenase-like lactoylglutathione lyase family enzyme
VSAAAPRVSHILETCLYGPDLAALERFYVDVIGLRPVARTEGRNVALECAESVLILFDPGVSGAPGGTFPRHGTTGPGHVAFAVPADELPAWRERLSAHGVAIETEWRWPDGQLSVYFRDPAGNSVELAPPTLWRSAR